MSTMASSLALWLTSISFNPVESAAVDDVDLAEINHVYDEDGQHTLDQIIFYDWCPREGRFQVRDWRMLRQTAQIPLRDWRTTSFVAVWHDFKFHDVLRRVHSKMLRETWTPYDPELVERDYLPKGKRKSLTRIHPKFLLSSAGPR